MANLRSRIPPADGITVRQKSRALFQRHRPKASIGRPLSKSHYARSPCRLWPDGGDRDPDEPRVLDTAIIDRQGIALAVGPTHTNFRLPIGKAPAKASSPL